MTNAIQNPTASSHDEPRARMLYPANGSAERQGVASQVSLDYLPMDIFVDSRIMRQHFQGSSVRSR